MAFYDDDDEYDDGPPEGSEFEADLFDDDDPRLCGGYDDDEYDDGPPEGSEFEGDLY